MCYTSNTIKNAHVEQEVLRRPGSKWIKTRKKEHSERMKKFREGKKDRKSLRLVQLLSVRGAMK